MSKFPFRGMMAPTFTPMHADCCLNLEIIPGYLTYLNSKGVKGIYVNGTSGEGMSLTVSERKMVAEAWMNAARRTGTTVVVQVGAGCLKDTKDLARHAESIGVDGIATLPCLYDKPESVEDLVDYCAEVANAAKDTPLLYYHIPFKTGVEVPMDEFLKAGSKSIPTLSGLKFTSMDISHEGMRCLKACEGKMRIFTGFDQTIAESLSLGYEAVISSCLNFMAEEAATIFRSQTAGQNITDESMESQQKINKVLEKLFKPSGKFSVAIIKTAMKLLTGIDVGPARRPLKNVTPEDQERIAESLKEVGMTLHL